MTTSKTPHTITPAELDLLEKAARSDSPSRLNMAVLDLVAEVRRQRAVLAVVDLMTLRLDQSVGRLETNSSAVAAELDRLRSLIVDYATSTMPFEQFLTLALGEQQAAAVMARHTQALAEAWHERL